MRILGFIGKLLISVGLGVLLFVAWILWGTGIYTNQQQDRLVDEFADLPALQAQGREDQGFGGPPMSYEPGPADPVFRMRIPKMDLDTIVVQGVGVEELKKGPGHYPGCNERFSRPLCTDLDEVWPGEKGRAIISGHRTTYDAPFWDLDRLQEGDSILTETRWGDFEYEVTGREIVQPDSRDIANPVASNTGELALTTCNPRFSAAERLVVYAELKTSV